MRLALLRAAQNGDRNAEEEFVAQNLGLVRSVVSRFSSYAEQEELFQIGCMGLIYAMQRFDFAYDVAFSTYAVPLILGEIRQFLRRDGRVHVSRAMRERMLCLTRVKERLYQTLLRAPTLSELAAETSLTVDEVAEAESVGSVCSLSELEHTLCAVDEDRTERLDLACAVQKLNERERQILRRRFLQDRTQGEVARELGVSQAQISRVERSAIKRLQKMLIGENEDELDRSRYCNNNGRG